MARRLALLVSITLCALVLPGAAPPTVFTPGSDGLGDPYFPLDGNGGYDVDHYDLALTYDPETDELDAVATIDAHATQNLSAFNLDLVGLTLESVDVNGAPADWERDDHELTITPSAGIRQKAAFAVRLAYHGVPETLMDGSGFIHTNDGAVIVGEPHVAATWFPANDHPTDKASFTFHWTVPEGIEAVANGVLVGQQTQDGWTTWTWDAPDPMTTYLSTATIGQLDIDAYKARGLQYWDAIDPALFEPEPVPEVVLPTDGDALLFSQATSQEQSASYKRLTRVLEIPPGGATLSFDTFHDTEGGWDFLFVEARTPETDDWTTLEEQSGLTSQDVGACPGFMFDHPFLEHYLTPFLVDEGDPEDPDDDFYSCDPAGTSGDWWAASGDGFEWETWSFDLPNAGSEPISREISITYASDAFIQRRGVALDNLVVSTGEGSTSFEDDGDQLDGWIAGDPPAGSAPNENTWDVFAQVDPPPPPPVVTPTDGAQMLFSDVADNSYKRLTRVLDVPPGGSMLSFDTFHDTEGAFDFLFVEARTAGGDDWTTLQELNGFTNQDVGACPFILDVNPFLDHYLTRVLIDPGDPEDPDDDAYGCDPTGTSGDWWAVSGDGTEWEAWQFNLANGSADPIQLEISITYASDPGFQLRGVTLDNLMVSSGAGSTSFEDDGDTLDGWVVADPPEGSGPNENSWTPIDELQPPPPPPPVGESARASLARQPEIIDFLSGIFGSYPFGSAGGIVVDAGVGFALETQTRPTYSPGFFFFGENTGVVVHEIAHQWVGDLLAVEAWQHIWLNEGFASYTEWLWEAHQGFATAQEIFDFYYNELYPDGDPFWELPIGDPGPDHLFDGEVYDRGAMTLHALRMQVGDSDFFRILQRWTREQANGNVTTDEFIALAEQVSHQQLDALFDAWLFGTTRPELSAAAITAQRTLPKGKDKQHVRDVVRPMVERHRMGHVAKKPFERQLKVHALTLSQRCLVTTSSPVQPGTGQAERGATQAPSNSQRVGFGSSPRSNCSIPSIPGRPNAFEGTIR